MPVQERLWILMITVAMLQIDVFAIVLDFWNVEHEHYDDNLGRH